jgi:hypothetical protein
LELDVPITSFEIQGARKSPYIFFTKEGLLWGVFSFGLFGLALLRSSGALLTLSFIFLGFTIIVILFTHENASGIRLSKITQLINLKTGASSLLVEVRNQTQSRRYQCSVSVSLSNNRKNPVLVHIPVLEKKAVHNVVIPLPWQKAGNPGLTVNRLILESKFPCGFTRSWYQLGQSKLSDSSGPMHIAAVPRPVLPEAAIASRMALGQVLADIGQGELRPYQNQNPVRIAWLPSMRSQMLLVRDSVANERDTIPNWDSTYDEIRTFRDIPMQANYVYAFALANFRAKHKFAITDDMGRKIFAWDKDLPKKALTNLIDLLSRFMTDGTEKDS